MRFAVNYSDPAAQLLARGAIRLDLFKVPPWPELIARSSRSAPAYVHFDLSAGSRSPDPSQFPAVAQVRQQTATPFVNTHLATRLAETSDHSRAATEAKLLADVGRLVEHFGAENVVVETVYNTDAERFFVPVCFDPAVVTRVVEAAGVGLILDLSHARLAAMDRGEDERGYIARLPVHRLRELHVTGVGEEEGALVDHKELSAADWALLEWTMDQVRAERWARPWCAALEYGGVSSVFLKRTKPGVLETQAPRVYELVRSV